METFAYFSSASQTQNTLDCGFPVGVHLCRQNYLLNRHGQAYSTEKGCNMCMSPHPADLASSVHASVPPKPDDVSTVRRALYGDVVTTDSCRGAFANLQVGLECDTTDSLSRQLYLDYRESHEYQQRSIQAFSRRSRQHSCGTFASLALRIRQTLPL